MRDIVDNVTLPVFGPTGIKISDSWSALWDGSIDVSLYDAGVIEYYSSWWTGSNNSV